MSSSRKQYEGGILEHFDVTHSNNEFHIEGIPDGDKVIAINDPLARRLADLILHRHDLEFALESLKSVNLVDKSNFIVQESLWRSSIIHLMKCFGDGERFSLSAEKILKTEPSVAKEVFDYFKAIRNKHLVHDENSYAQSLPFAVLNNGKKIYKVEKIVCMGAWVRTLEQANYSNLNMLLSKILSWVISEFDTLAEKITSDLEAKSFEELSSMMPAKFEKPKIEEITLKRK